MWNLNFSWCVSCPRSMNSITSLCIFFTVYCKFRVYTFANSVCCDSRRNKCSYFEGIYLPRWQEHCFPFWVTKSVLQPVYVFVHEWQMKGTNCPFIFSSRYNLIYTHKHETGGILRWKCRISVKVPPDLCKPFDSFHMCRCSTQLGKHSQMAPFLHTLMP